MALHMKKLSVGSESIEGLAEWHATVLARDGRIMHVTRSFPRRANEILSAGGSMYWVIKGRMCARQVIEDFAEVERGDSKPACGIVLRPGLIPVLQRKSRPFQGWRYLEAPDAPPDLPQSEDGSSAAMPDEIAEELRDLGLL